MSQHDFATMQRQRESLLERLTEFEATNRTLRAMLRERHEQEANAGRVAEQRDLLLKKLTETETRLEVRCTLLLLAPFSLQCSDLAADVPIGRGRARTSHLRAGNVGDVTAAGERVAVESAEEFGGDARAPAEDAATEGGRLQPDGRSDSR